MAKYIKISTGRRRLSCKRYLAEAISVGGRAPIGASKGRSPYGLRNLPEGVIRRSGSGYD